MHRSGVRPRGRAGAGRIHGDGAQQRGRRPESLPKPCSVAWRAPVGLGGPGGPHGRRGAAGTGAEVSAVVVEHLTLTPPCFSMLTACELVGMGIWWLL